MKRSWCKCKQKSCDISCKWKSCGCDNDPLNSCISKNLVIFYIYVWKLSTRYHTKLFWNKLFQQIDAEDLIQSPNLEPWAIQLKHQQGLSLCPICQPWSSHLHCWKTTPYKRSKSLEWPLKDNLCCTFGPDWMRQPQLGLTFFQWFARGCSLLWAEWLFNVFSVSWAQVSTFYTNRIGSTF